MGRGNKRRVRGPIAPAHDRRAEGPVHQDVAPSIVDDPYEQGGKITVLRSLRDDPLARMHVRGQIDDAQMAAGRHWQHSYEIAEIGGATGIDPTRDYVDGGRIPEPLTDARRRAVRDLNRAARLVGVIGESVLRDVLVLGMMPAQVAAARGYSDERSIRFYARTFRDALEALAVEYGFASKEVPISG